MKIKVEKLYNATIVLATIIRENRALPQKGKYRIARMHAKLLPEFNVIDGQKDELIKAYDNHVMIDPPLTKEDPLGQGPKIAGPEFCVPQEKLAEFSEALKKILDEEIEVDIEPIPLSYLDLGDQINGSISANELVTLGELVTE